MTGRELLVYLKAAARRPPPWALPVGRPVRAVLRPVATTPGAIDAEDVRLLTAWRNRFVRCFLTEFDATEERTVRWLREIVGPAADRILLMLEDASGRTFGHMGLTAIRWRERSAEADAVLRGEEAPPGTMKQALTTLLSWARRELGLANLAVRVRSDNEALAFYHKAGFRERRRVPLRRLEEPGMVRWVEDKTLTGAAVEVVYLCWSGATDHDRD